MKYRTTLVLLACALPFAGYGANGTIISSGNWSNPAIWQNTITPSVTGDWAYIQNGANVVLSSTEAVTLGRLTIGTSNATNGTAFLTMSSGGAVSISDRLYVGDRCASSTLSITGGKITLGSSTSATGTFYVASGLPATGSTTSGTVTISGGELYIGRNFVIGANVANGASTASVTVNGGRLVLDSTYEGQVGYANTSGSNTAATLSLFSGTFTMGGQLTVGNGTSTTYSGTGHVIVSSNMDTAYVGANFRLNGNNSSLTILAEGSDFSQPILTVGGSLMVLNNSVVNIDLSGFEAGSMNVGETITLTLVDYATVQRNASTNTYNVYGLDEDHFSVGSLTWGADALTINVTYTNAIPEPAVAAGLIGALAMGFALRRRRA